MNKSDVINVLMTEVSERVGDRTVELKKVTKNNGIVLNGISIKMKNVDMVSATIYVDDIVERIIEGDMTYEEAVNHIIEIDEDAQTPDFVGDVNYMDILTNKEYVLSRVHRNLVNKELNKDCIDEFPHKEFCDLLIVYRITVSDTTTARMTNALMDKLGLSVEELDEAARENDKTTWNVVSMGDIIRSRTGEEVDYDVIIDEFMQIVTNESRHYGAASITDPGFMEKMAERYRGDFFILPCSVHECILVPGVLCDNVEALKGMVKAVNTEEISPGEVLSDSVYLYDNSTKTVKVA